MPLDAYASEATRRRALSLTALSWLVAALVAVAPARAFAFEYAGLSLGVGPMELLDLFPDSRHEFWERGTGSVLLPDDEGGRFDTALAEGTGRYVIRLVPDDTRGQVTSISLTMEAGTVARMTLDFRRPGDGIRPQEIENRYPKCRPVLDALVARYGQPVSFKTYNEDNLQHRVRSWAGPDGGMHLDCGKFNGRSAIFAMDIELTPPSEEVPGGPVSKPAAKAGTRKKP